MTSSEEDTLYKRVGGQDGIDRLVDSFYDRVLADPELSPFFQQTAMDTLRRMQREFFTAALGGPVSYSGKPLDQAHAGRDIKAVHLRRFVGHLVDTLDEEFDLDPEDESAITDRIWHYADEVTGSYGFPS
ncbi:MAG: group 1 truncated hemoglobin [Longimicrobiales bacterium]|nr:group 1 truncated hemoglobin [Longimicrobiales bacterium]